MNLVKWKKYKGLVSDEEQGYTVHALDQITSKGLYMTDTDRLLAQTDGYRQKYVPSTNSYSKKVFNQNCKCMETHINSSNHTFPLGTHVL